MIPNFSAGVFRQTLWREVGDIDECWVLADIMCVHSIAGWLPLPGTTAYRAAAGNPDDPNVKDGGTVAQSAKAIKLLWPKLTIQVMSQGPFADLIAKVKAGHPASLAVKSGALPYAQRYGYTGNHSISLYWTGTTLRSLNPLGKAHSLGDNITEAQVKAAVLAFDPKGVWAIVWPTVEEAFKTHPLYTP